MIPCVATSSHEWNRSLRRFRLDESPSYSGARTHARRMSAASLRSNSAASPYQSCRRYRRTEPCWSIDHRRTIMPGRPCTGNGWPPQPAISIHKLPMAEPVRHPSPRICGHPHVASRSKVPVAVGKWVPSNVGAVGLPHGSVARDVKILSVIIQVADAILIRRT